MVQQQLLLLLVVYLMLLVVLSRKVETKRILKLINDFMKIGLHPTTIAEAFQKAADKATEILKSISIPADLNDKDALHRSAATSLNSKVF